MRKPPIRAVFLLAEDEGFEPISMQQPGGLLRPPVQKPVAALLFAIGEKAIESLIQSPQQAEKLEFVGMPPRAMRAFARVIIFPSFGHARFVFAVVVYSI